MVVPVIAIGVYELLAAGAAATGLGAFAVAKRHEIAEGLSDAGTTVADSATELSLKALPWIMAATTGVRPQGLWRTHDTVQTPIPVIGLDLDLDAIRPWSPPILHIEDAPPVAEPRPAPIPLDLIAGGLTGTPMPPMGPEDPLSGLRRLAERAKDVGGQIKSGAARLAQNRWVQGLYTLYRWYNYGLAATATAEISRRMIVGSPDHGPILYDYIYQPIFGESAVVRTLFGGQQLMAEESSAGMLAVTLAKVIAPKWLTPWLDADKFVFQLPSFLSIHAYSFLGNWSFIEHQMVANNTEAGNVDFDRATRTSGFFGFTSIAYFPIKDWLINLPRFGRMGFREWWMRWGAAEVPTLQRALTSTEGINWLGAQLYRGVESFSPRMAAALAPHYIPKLSTIGVYAVFATFYRNATQAIASLPFFEDSDMGQSLKMTNARSAASTLIFDPYLYLGSKSNSIRSILGNQLVFGGLVYVLDQFYSPFDGKDVAVVEADRTLKNAFAKGNGHLGRATLSKPLTQRNLWAPPQTDLSVKTWAELTQQYAAQETINPAFVTALIRTMKVHFNSHELGERRVGKALGVMLSQIALPSATTVRVWSGWRAGLKTVLDQNGVRIDPHYANRALNAQELERVFRDINSGLYDESPLFQFPRA